MVSHRWITPGGRLIAAVSGGSDSMALLEILNDLRDTIPFELSVAHFEHGIRPEAVLERELVERRAESLGLPVMIGSANVPYEARKRRMGIEETGRILRYDFLERCALSWKACAVALGHTKDDQVETILHNLLRGSGLRGLCGMPERRGLFIRPLLGCSRAELREFLRKRGVRWATDSSNIDISFTRNRIRRVLIPLLRKRFNPAIEDSLIRLASNLAESRDALEKSIKKILPEITEDEEVRLPLEKIRKLNDFELYLLIDLTLRERFYVTSDIEKKHYDSIKLLARKESSGKLRHLPHGIDATVEHGALSFHRRIRRKTPMAEIISGPGRHILPDWRLEVSVEPVESPTPELRATERKAVFFGLKFPIRVRQRKPGDRIVPFGMKGSKKLSDLMIDKKIPRSRRDLIPVFEDALGPFWVPGVVTHERTRVESGKGPAMAIRILQIPESFDSNRSDRMVDCTNEGGRRR